MPIRIAFINGKGGVGKTTATTLVAAALKAAGQSVSIDDRDPQLSSTTACSIFDIPLGDSGSIVLIDTAPVVQSPATLDAIQTADLVVLVTTPSPLDLATTAATAKWIETERGAGQTRVLFNMVQANTRFSDEIAEVAKDLPFKPFQTYLARRIAYQAAQLHGWKALPADLRSEALSLAMEIMSATPQLMSDNQAVRQ